MGRALEELPKVAQALDAGSQESFKIRMQFFRRQPGNQITHDRWSRYGTEHLRRVRPSLLVRERHRDPAMPLRCCDDIRQRGRASPCFVLTGKWRRESIRSPNL